MEVQRQRRGTERTTGDSYMMPTPDSKKREREAGKEACPHLFEVPNTKKTENRVDARKTVSVVQRRC
ncbi:hypothetical protein E2C01_018260 [Portunus trituberculatus]|uniref:Uncharacterized protein n=1 Tax=Portunus trituberculatus TaxID=210409 RepID=A0A5B7DUM9_PORTR|nr:hypothetical protein [Portunus trituberculatus]